uniref:Uncharacterized protein n=1 Tax=Siphoviridae sp. ctLfk13 TaxID=2826251 RepID=A0A8S5N1C3_9CAUD|nr:MAG TPA: hypothetical protein [Siphoviridae sp. ctLfk13]
MLTTYTHPPMPKITALPTRVTYPPHLCNLTHATIHIMRCLVIALALYTQLTRLSHTNQGHKVLPLSHPKTIDIHSLRGINCQSRRSHLANNQVTNDTPPSY